jgi:hypothetical protein
LPFFDLADATLHLSGLSAMLLWPGCQVNHSAWVPLYFIRPERHVTLAWVPTLGLGAVVLIWLMPRPIFESSLGAVAIYLAWVPFLFKAGKLAIHSRQVRHFTQVWQVRQSVIYPALVPRSFLTADAPHLLNSPDWHSLRGLFVKPSVKNWTFVENPSVKLRCLELAFEKHAESSF